MVIRHKKNTAYYLALPMVDSATPASFKTGLSPTDTAYYKDGAGAWTSLPITDTFAEIGATGIYEIDLTAAELNHDQVIIKITSAGAADTFIIFEMDSIEIDDIPTTAMRGTDNAALASVCTEARLAELAAANLPTDIAAIPTTAMRGTDSAALASVATEARLSELDAANLPTDIAAIPTTAMRGTENAALASVCSEARLAELAAANLPADVDTLKTRCTEARLAELDAANLPTDVAAIPTNPALATVCTEARLAELDGANLPNDVNAVGVIVSAIQAICTEARLAELDGANLPAVSDSIKVKTDSLPASWNMADLAAVPAINATIVEAINWIYVICRNRKRTNKTTKEIEVYKDNSTTKFAESDVDDDGTFFDQGKFGAVD
jgi:hypothetical protein